MAMLTGAHLHVYKYVSIGSWQSARFANSTYWYQTLLHVCIFLPTGFGKVAVRKWCLRRQATGNVLVRNRSITGKLSVGACLLARGAFGKILQKLTNTLPVHFAWQVHFGVFLVIGMFSVILLHYKGTSLVHLNNSTSPMYTTFNTSYQDSTSNQTLIHYLSRQHKQASSDLGHVQALPQAGTVPNNTSWCTHQTFIVDSSLVDGVAAHH